MSLKEWKNNELGGLLMKKFGILKEGELKGGLKDYMDKQKLKTDKNGDSDDDKPSAPAGGAEATADDEKEAKNESVRRPDAAGDRNNFAGQKTDAELQGKLHEEDEGDEEELDEGQLCEECGGYHKVDEGGLADRPENSENAAGRKEGGRYKRMQESIRRTLKENRNIRLKIRR